MQFEDFDDLIVHRIRRVRKVVRDNARAGAQQALRLKAVMVIEKTFKVHVLEPLPSPFGFFQHDAIERLPGERISGRNGKRSRVSRVKQTFELPFGVICAKRREAIAVTFPAFKWLDRLNVHHHVVQIRKFFFDGADHVGGRENFQARRTNDDGKTVFAEFDSGQMEMIAVRVRDQHSADRGKAQVVAMGSGEYEVWARQGSNP